MVAMLRVKRTRPPFADTSKHLADVGAVEHHGVGLGATLDSVAAVAGIPLERVGATSERRRRRCSAAPSTRSLPEPPISASGPLEPSRVSLPLPPSMVMAVRAARLPTALVLSLPPRPLTTRRSAMPSTGTVPALSTRTSVPFAVTAMASAAAVPLYVTVSMSGPPSTLRVATPGTPTWTVARSAPPKRLAAMSSAGSPPLTRSCVDQAVDDLGGAGGGDRHGIVAVRADRGDDVRRGVAATAERSQVGVERAQVGAGHVVDDDRVGAAQRVERDALDVVEVERDVRDVADEQHARAVGRDVDVLADVGAVEGHGVAVGPALDGVVAVAGIPLERVGAAAQQGDVLAAVAVDEVVAGAADELLGRVAADQRVVAGPAVDGDGLVDGGRRRDDADRVVAGAGGDVEVREEGAIEREVDRAVVADVDERRFGHGDVDPVARAVAGELQVLRLDARLVGGRGGVCRDAEQAGQRGAGDEAEQECATSRAAGRASPRAVVQRVQNRDARRRRSSEHGYRSSPSPESWVGRVVAPSWGGAREGVVAGVRPCDP